MAERLLGSLPQNSKTKCHRNKEVLDIHTASQEYLLAAKREIDESSELESTYNQGI